ncbi:hypothetical protein IWW51_003743 [Coemansia sp. RSA 2702]|nr:hypothetical protein IWW51_003743 [Coemansia sp. RSA 2702]KAJ2719867.1 hypothetical protein H4R23_004795 [Coemansia sp. Cherry 401B]
MADSKQSRSRGSAPAAGQQLDGQAAGMQRLLDALAEKVELAEKLEAAGPSCAGDEKQQQQQQQAAVGDALKDMALAEQAMGSFETQLDALLDRLDTLIDESAPPDANTAPAAKKPAD